MTGPEGPSDAVGTAIYTCNHHSVITCNSPQAEYAGIITVYASPERETRRERVPPVRREFRADSAQVCLRQFCSKECLHEYQLERDRTVRRIKQETDFMGREQ